MQQEWKKLEHDNQLFDGHVSFIRTKEGKIFIAQCRKRMRWNGQYLGTDVVFEPFYFNYNMAPIPANEVTHFYPIVLPEPPTE